MGDFNGYDFSNPKARKRMKYLIITEGDLDVNNAYAFTSKKNLKAFLKESYKTVEAVFSVKDIGNSL